jgi:hypothetical protein
MALTTTQTAILAGATSGAVAGLVYGWLQAPKGDREHDAVHFGWIGAAVGTVAGVFWAGKGSALAAAPAPTMSATTG